jgi:hypothetical protein
MLSSTIIVTTEPGLVKATARPRPAITGISVVTSALAPSSIARTRVEVNLGRLDTIEP